MTARKPLKVAILGSAESTRDKAPFDDPEWEIWGLAWRVHDHPRMNRIFEVHNRDVWGEYVVPEAYERFFSDPFDKSGINLKVYMLPHEAARFEKVTPYPVEEAKALMGGRNYFTSSFSYMLALAILEGATEIACYGIDLVAGDEYIEQRPAAEFLLGIAHAKGIKITIPGESALLQSGFVYGLQDRRDDLPMKRHYEEKREKYQEKIKELKSQIYALEGGVHEIGEFLAAIDATRRGLWAGKKG